MSVRNLHCWRRSGAGQLAANPDFSSFLYLCSVKLTSYMESILEEFFERKRKKEKPLLFTVFQHFGLVKNSLLHI
jgi:hypothetical protein